MNEILENYLIYLNEFPSVAKKAFAFDKKYLKGVGSKALSFDEKRLMGSAKSGILYSAAIAGAMATWKAANILFSKAVRKCGPLKKNTPGFKVCVAKERIKSLQQKIIAGKKILASCNKSKNPEICKQKWQLEIEKCNNRIEINKNRIQDILGESRNVQEVLPALVIGAYKLGLFMVLGVAVDKAIFLANRSALALFSQASKKCGIYKQGTERELCVSKIKLLSLTKQFGIYKTVLSKCGNQKDPEKCNEKVRKHIEKIVRDIKIQKDNISAYNREIAIKKREEQFKNSMKSVK